MTSQGPFHVGCAPAWAGEEEPELNLQFGGSLVCSDTRSGIAYTFPGRDRRYRWSHFFIGYDNLLNTAEAVRANWLEFERMRSAVGLGANVRKHGVLGMAIHLSLIAPGVWVFYPHICVSSADLAARYEGELRAAHKKLQRLCQLLRI